MIRKKPLEPSHAEVFGHKRFHVGFVSGVVQRVLSEDGESVSAEVLDES